MPLTTAILAVCGLGLLAAGSELLVRGASRLAAALGISPLVIGLTVVAFGTSSPELAVSLKSALAGQADIAMGNVVGSNILNVLLILGLSALVAPLPIQRQLLRVDVPLMIGVSGLVLLLGLDGRIGRLDGLLLAAGLAGYLALSIRLGRREGGALAAAAAASGVAPAARRSREVALDAGLAVAGLVALVAGSRWLVDGAVALAVVLGADQLVIGLTVVAAGTSLPEVATSVTAARRGERDIAVGNVVGSNLFNLLAVLGLTSAAAPGGVAVARAALAFDLPVMLLVALVCLPVFFTGRRVARAEGALFLAGYVAYTVYLVLHASDHHALPLLRAAVTWVAAPVVAGGLAWSVAGALRRPSGPRPAGRVRKGAP